MTDNRQLRTRRSSNEYAGDRAARVSGERMPTVRSQELHYNKQYGTTLSGGQYEALEDDRKVFETGVSDTRSQISGFQSEKDAAQKEVDASRSGLASAKKEYQGKLDDATASLKSWENYKTSDEFAQIHIWNEWKPEAVYYFPKDSVAAMAKNLEEDGAKRDKHFGTWNNDGTGNNIWVNQGGSELHQSLFDLQERSKNEYNAGLNLRKAEISKSQRELDSQVATWQGSINTSQGNLDVSQVNIDSSTDNLNYQVDSRETSLNGIKQKYTDRLSRIKDTINAMTQGGGQ